MLPRKDVRFKMDHDMHEAMTIIADLSGTNIDKWVERTICKAIRDQVMAANVLAKRAESLRISGKSGETNSEHGELTP